jgi:hypothetical protein
MADKKQSKGNFFNFIEDASKKNSKVRKEMLTVVKKKGLNADKLLQEFQKRGYDGVSLRDCRRMMELLKRPGYIQMLDGWQY